MLILWLLLIGVGVGFAVAGQVLPTAAACLLMQSIFCWNYRSHPLLLVFGVFLMISFVEVVFAEIFGLDHYFLMVHEWLPAALLMQAAICLPAAIFVVGKQGEQVSSAPRSLSDGVISLLIIAGFFLVHFGVQGQSVIGADYDTYRQNIAAGSGLIEYLLLYFVFVASLRKDGFLRYAFAMLLLYYFFKCSILGFRVQAIMAGLVFIASFMGGTSPRKMLIFIVFGFLLALLLGGLKHSGDVIAGAALLNSGYIQSAHSGSLVSSTNILSNLDLDWAARLQMILSFLAPFSFFGDDVPWAQPGRYVQNFVPTPGGVLAGVHVYLIAGVPGILLLGFLVRALIKVYVAPPARLDGGVYSVFWGSALVAFCFVPRWALYDVGNYGFRMILTYIVLSGIVAFGLFAVRRVRQT